jgi:AhpD family alkylhydroperoxidase
MTAIAEVPDELVRALRGLDGAVWLEPGLRELVAVRTAQLDGCSEQLAEHALAALELGETPARLVALSDPNRSQAFTRREQAALALVDALAGADPARLAEARREAALHFEPVELAHIAFTCAAAAAWDRLVLAAA